MLRPTSLQRSHRDGVSIDAQVTEQRVLVLTIKGRLDSMTTGHAWRMAMKALKQASPKRVLVDATAVDYCDGAGIGLLVALRGQQKRRGGDFEVRGLQTEFQDLLSLFDPAVVDGFESVLPRPPGLVEEIGRQTLGVLEDIYTIIVFVGELGAALVGVARHPRRVRWKDILLVAERAGVNALPIVTLISFLVGLIMAFQAAIPMRQFGAEIFVADLIAISMVRELGPLITAILLAGRSGSSFAAELGTMKVNEELDALTTMGLDPVRFLVVTRVIAAVAMTPLLTLFSNLIGVIGGSLVLISLGYPLVTYMNRVFASLDTGDLLGGLFKSLIFGILIAGIGCLRGIQTKGGASAVGESTTRAVVSGLVLIVIADGILSAVYYYLGI
jgi:phospholipid/cholesterol/gamma-HCH transport system permease protein